MKCIGYLGVAYLLYLHGGWGYVVAGAFASFYTFVLEVLPRPPLHQ